MTFEIICSEKKITILPNVTYETPIFKNGVPISYVHIPKTSGFSINYLMMKISKIKQFNSLGAYSSCNGSGVLFRQKFLGGIARMQEYPDFYDLSKKPKVMYITGHMPLPSQDFFKIPVSYITIVRDPLERAISHINFLYQNQEIKPEEKENLIINEEIGNLQTRWLAGEEFMQGDCTEEVYQKALKNIVEKFTIVAPMKDTDLVMAILAKHFGVANFAYSRTRVSETKIMSKNEMELCNKILEKNSYDKRLYEFVDENWKNWKQTNIIHVDYDLKKEDYFLMDMSFYQRGSVKLISNEDIEEKLAFTSNEIECIDSHTAFWSIPVAH